MLTANELKGYIMNALPCEHVEVLGDDGQHFEAVVVSPQFTGKNKVQQHQLVYLALGDRMAFGNSCAVHTHIHARCLGAISHQMTLER